MDELCGCINIYFFNYIPLGLSAAGWPQLYVCSLLLTIGCFTLPCDSEKPEKPALQCSLICALLNLCIHEMQIRYLVPSSIHSASSTFCAYILTSLCELLAVVFR